MAKRRLFSALISGVLVMAVSLGLASPAHAATGSSLLVPVYYPVNFLKLSNLPQTIVAGDCRLKGLNQVDPGYAQVNLYQYDAPGGPVYDVVWSAVAYTVHSLFGDVWHATFVFRKANGLEVFRVNFDGPEMHKNEVHTFTKEAPVDITPNQFLSIVYVDWIGDC